MSKATNGGAIKRAQLARLVIRECGRCRYCGCLVRQSHPSDDRRASLDHILPRERRGTRVPINAALACARCNVRRAIDGHCIAALRCAEAVIGSDEPERVLAAWFRDATAGQQKARDYTL